MKHAADYGFFSGNRGAALLSALFGIMLLASCDSGNNSSSFAPVTSPPGGGGGPVFFGGGSSPTQIGTPRNSSYTLSPPQVALNDSDAAVAVWQETDSLGAQKIWANARTGSSWGSASAIDLLVSADPRVAIAPNGQVVVVWSRNSSTSNPPNNTLWSRRYVNGTWQAAQRISAIPTTDNTAYPLSPAVATDINGTIMVVWTDNGLTSGNARSLWMTHFDGNAWSTPQVLSDGTHTAYETRVAVTGIDTFTVVWTQDTPGTGTVVTPNLWSNRYSGGTWGTAVSMGLTAVAAGDSAAHLNLAANDAGGDAVVVWEQTQGALVSIAGNRYQASSGLWGSATLVDTASTSVNSPVVAVDNAGNAIALWQQTDGTAMNVWASGASAGAAWQTPTRLGSQGIGAENIRIGMDAGGNALAVWQLGPTTTLNPTLKSRRYLSATGWDSSSSTLSMTGTDMALDVNSGGKALVVTIQKVNNGIDTLSAPWALLYQP